jgi:hypothetical protein
MPGMNGRSSSDVRTAAILGADVADLGVSEPVTTMPTRNDTQAVSPTVKYANRPVTFQPL